MTGPFDFFTTSSSVERGGSATVGAGAVAASVRSFSDTEQPVMIAAEVMTALRIRNVRRSTPGRDAGQVELLVRKQRRCAIRFVSLHDCSLSGFHHGTDVRSAASGR